MRYAVEKMTKMNLKTTLSGFDGVDSSSIRRIIAELDYLLPGWLYELHIKLRDDGQTCATAHVDSRYARATIQLWPGLLIKPELEVREYIAHEFAHIIMGGLTEHVLELATDAPHLTYHLERATEDVARAIMAAINA